jgi:hypothetical protein
MKEPNQQTPDSEIKSHEKNLTDRCMGNRPKPRKNSELGDDLDIATKSKEGKTNSTHKMQNRFSY